MGCAKSAESVQIQAKVIIVSVIRSKLNYIFHIRLFDCVSYVNITNYAVDSTLKSHKLNCSCQNIE